MQFEPFQDRLSRDIRNDLSATIGTVLDQLDLSEAQEVADRYLSRDIKSYYKDYQISFVEICYQFDVTSSQSLFFVVMITR